MRLRKTSARLGKREIIISRDAKSVKDPLNRNAHVSMARKAGGLSVAMLTQFTSKTGKFRDTGKPMLGSRLDKYYSEYPVLRVFEKQRSGGVKVPNGFIYFDPQFLTDHFALQGIQYGNWLNQEDRLNYTAAFGLSMLDMQSVLKFNNKAMGQFGRLGFAFGARGKGKALAHYEPVGEVINLTRYHISLGNSIPKWIRQLSDGGIGSLAHEYGHAIDYFAGAYLQPVKYEYSISDGDSTRTTTNQKVAKKPTIRGKMERLMNAIIWSRPGVQTEYYKRIKTLQPGNYLIQRNEIFARTFEQWMAYKLAAKKAKNIFLTKTKYGGGRYMKPAEFKRIVPIMDRLMVSIKTKINTVTG